MLRSAGLEQHIHAVPFVSEVSVTRGWLSLRELGLRNLRWL